jgi:UDP-2,3-diacylglucosamine pyrophosphatase LpxH
MKANVRVIETPKRELFISDTHFPYEDKQAWSLTLRVIQAVKPDLIYLGGDIIDFYALSSFDKDPRRALDLQDEISYTKERLWEMTENPQTRIVWYDGNHEQRLERYMHRKAKEFAYLENMSISALLNLDKAGIEHIPNGVKVRVGHLHHLHGNEVPGGSVNPSWNILQKVGVNVIMGHFHRAQVAYKRDLDGKTYGAWVNGTISTMDVDWVMHHNWTHGVTLVQYAKSGTFQVQQLMYYPHPDGSDTLSTMVDGRQIDAGFSVRSS